MNCVSDTCNGHAGRVVNIAEQQQTAAHIEYPTGTHSCIPKKKLSLCSLVDCAGPAEDGKRMQRHQVHTLHQHVRPAGVLCPRRQADSIAAHVHYTRSCSPSRLALLCVTCTHPICSVLLINHATHHDMLSVTPNISGHVREHSVCMTAHMTQQHSLVHPFRSPLLDRQLLRAMSYCPP